MKSKLSILLQVIFHDNATGVIVNNYNPTDKIIQLYEDKIALYERMLKEKDNMICRLED